MANTAIILGAVGAIIVALAKILTVISTASRKLVKQ